VELLEDRLVPAIVEKVTDLTGALTANALVAALLGPGVTATNISYTGFKYAAGEFSGFQSAIGIDSGVVLSNGAAGNGTESPPGPAASSDAQGVMGPNNDAAFTGSINGGPSDPDLDAIVGATGFDATVLQFDFVPQNSTISFQYVWGSEEYPDFVNAGFNDVFAFFVNGKNAALVPGTTTPVSVDNINSTTNSQYYVDNTSGAFFTQMNAFTKVLPVNAAVNPGQVNHIKLAIEDTGDDIYDSWVLIKAGSLSSPPAPVVRAFHPVRYVQIGNHLAGSFSLINYGNLTLQGPLYVYLPKLPAGVTVDNYTGFHDSKGYFALPPKLNMVPFKAVHLYMSFSNPLHQHLSTFLLSFPVTVTTVIL
jgi:hypothetical protein